MKYYILEQDELASEFIVNIVDEEISFNVFCHPYEDINFITKLENIDFSCLLTQLLPPKSDLSRNSIEKNDVFEHRICGKLIDLNIIKINNYKFFLDIEIDRELLNKFITIRCERIDLLSEAGNVPDLVMD